MSPDNLKEQSLSQADTMTMSPRLWISQSSFWEEGEMLWMLIKHRLNFTNIISMQIETFPTLINISSV